MTQTSTPETISFHANTWFENASIVGLANVLGKGHYTLPDENMITVKVSELENNFAQKYYDCLIARYAKYTKFHTEILNKKSVYQTWLDNQFKDLTDKQVINYVEFATKTLPKFLKSGKMINRGFNLIDDPVLHSMNDALNEKTGKPANNMHGSLVVKIENELSPLTKSKTPYTDDPNKAIDILQQNIPIVVDILDRLEQNSDSIDQQYLTHAIINNFIDVQTIKANTSKSNKEDKNAKIDNNNISYVKKYQDRFVQPLLNYLKNPDKGSMGGICINCGRPMIKKNLRNSLYVNTLGYNDKQKISNAYNVNGDVVSDNQCVVCQFLYSLGALGFTYNLAHKGLFINNNSSLQKLITTNQKLQTGLKAKESNDNNNIIHMNARQMLGNYLSMQKLSTHQNFLDNVQVVFWNQNTNDDTGTYSTNIMSSLSSKILKKIVPSEDHNNNLLSALHGLYITTDNDNTNRLYLDSLIIKDILDEKSIEPLLLKIFQLKATQSPNASSIHYQKLKFLLNLNNIIVTTTEQYLHPEEAESMTQVTKESLLKTKGCGYKVWSYYKTHENVNKVNNIIYQLLQSMHNDDFNRFTEILIRVYASQQAQVPKIFVETLNEPVAFKQYALAFIAGLINDPNYNPDKPANKD